MKMSHKYILPFGGQTWSETKLHKYCANWNYFRHDENSKKKKRFLIGWMKTERVSTTL